MVKLYVFTLRLIIKFIFHKKYATRKKILLFTTALHVLFFNSLPACQTTLSMNCGQILGAIIASSLQELNPKTLSERVVSMRGRNIIKTKMIDGS